MAQTASVPEAFERALEIIQMRVSALEDNICPDVPPARAGIASLAVAFSGGLDSCVLLRLAHRYADDRGIPLFAFHVHHGLSPNADAWLQHCEEECAALDVRFAFRRVSLSGGAGGGVEQEARIARYAALGEMCESNGVRLLLTAHHQDDQAETVILQLLRGSGVAGLSGMEIANTAPGLLHNPRLLMARPMLEVSRTALERYASEQGIVHIEDESNKDLRFARNALRHRIVPAIAEYFPGFQDRIARSAQHAHAARRLLNEIAEQDLARCGDSDSLDLAELARLSPERFDNAMRFWMARHAVRMPATAWLAEMREQLLHAKDDAQVRVVHPDCEIRRYRNKVYLISRMDRDPADGAQESFRWRGEPRLEFPGLGGVLHFEPAAAGLDAAWLRDRELQIGPRRAGQKLKPARNRHTRSLKHHYQSLNIPLWERDRLPVVTAGETLLFAAGIGIDWQGVVDHEGPSVTLRWEKHFR